MRSEAQKAASRANGSKSRGPVTPEGRQRCAVSALTHGFTAKSFLLQQDSPDRFDSVMAALVERFQPSDAAEAMLVEEMAVCEFSLRRAWIFRVALIEHKMDEMAPAIAQTYERIDMSTRIALAFDALIAPGCSLRELENHANRFSRQSERAMRRLLLLRNSVPLPDAGSPLADPNDLKIGKGPDAPGSPLSAQETAGPIGEPELSAAPGSAGSPNLEIGKGPEPAQLPVTELAAPPAVVPAGPLPEAIAAPDGAKSGKGPETASSLPDRTASPERPGIAAHPSAAPPPSDPSPAHPAPTDRRPPSSTLQGSPGPAGVPPKIGKGPENPVPSLSEAA